MRSDSCARSRPTTARAAGYVDPEALVEACAATPGGKSKAVTSVLWYEFGDGTIATLCDGTKALAALWEGAWRVADGETRFSMAAMEPMNENACATATSARPSSNRWTSITFARC